jgi:hypothetical protein
VSLIFNPPPSQREVDLIWLVLPIRITVLRVQVSFLTPTPRTFVRFLYCVLFYLFLRACKPLP